VSDAEFNKRSESVPDAYTLAWWKQQFAELLTGYRGASHSMNRLAALCDDVLTENKTLRERLAKVESEQLQDRAKIGELQERIERMAAWAAKQQQRAKGASE
jgi:glucose-6-phosphate dehydrogenase assembly protein OpcA